MARAVCEATFSVRTQYIAGMPFRAVSFSVMLRQALEGRSQRVLGESREETLKEGSSAVLQALRAVETPFEKHRERKRVNFRATQEADNPCKRLAAAT